MPNKKSVESLNYLCELSALLGFAASMSPSFLVFHGGSGSTTEEIQTAVNNGVVKMNVDTGSYRFICFYVMALTVP